MAAAVMVCTIECSDPTSKMCLVRSTNVDDGRMKDQTKKGCPEAEGLRLRLSGSPCFSEGRAIRDRETTASGKHGGWHRSVHDVSGRMEETTAAATVSILIPEA